MIMSKKTTHKEINNVNNATVGPLFLGRLITLMYDRFIFPFLFVECFIDVVRCIVGETEGIIVGEQSFSFNVQIFS